ncbi:membrane protein [Bacteroidia bacterium]|nr:membrane protein [Bacteroidia bacterium]
MKRRHCHSLLLAFLCLTTLPAQEKRMTLSQCVEIATDHSLQAFRAKNMYLSGYWAFRTYKAGRLPFVSLQLTPVQYNSNFIKRYDYNQNIEVYRQQQSIASSAGLSLSQNLDLTGGTFTFNSGLDYLRNFGENIYTQYSTIPVRMGYSQSLFGFNRFKWEKKIEPLKYEKVKKQYLYSRESLSETATRYFFNLAMAQAEYDMAVENVSSADSLYLAGKERSRISSISQADLLTLHLDFVNAENALENATTQLQKTMFGFISFFNLEKDDKIYPDLPEKTKEISITAAEAIAAMKENNPDILACRQQVLESEQELERIRKTGGFDADFSAGVGFNQAGNTFRDAYIDPSRQDMVRIGITIPIVDWGIRKGRINMAKNNLDATQLAVRQSEQDLEQEVISVVAEFQKQQKLIARAVDALQMAITSYNINKQRFLIGKADVNTLTLSLNRRKDAQRNYLSALNNYWQGYYAIRKLTLFDFEKRETLSFQFDGLFE